MTYEASGNFSEWPPNVPDKPTQVAVYGLFQPSSTTESKRYEILWTGKFPDLEKAMYWGAKKELEAIRKRKFVAASRVLWQHDIPVEQAVEVAYLQTAPQMNRALDAADLGFDPMGAFGDDSGPLKPVDYSKIKGLAIELEGPGGIESPTFFVPLNTDKSEGTSQD